MLRTPSPLNTLLRWLIVGLLGFVCLWSIPAIAESDDSDTTPSKTDSNADSKTDSDKTDSKADSDKTDSDTASSDTDSTSTDAASTPAAPEIEIPISLVYTTDIQGQLRKFQCRNRDASWQNQIDLANHLYQINALRRRHKKKKLPQPLVFNTGDNLAPSISARYLLEFEGIAGIEAIAQAFGMFRYDMVGLGNHEFSVKRSKLVGFLRRSRRLGVKFFASNLKIRRLSYLFPLLNRNRLDRPQPYFVYKRTYKQRTVRIGVFHLLPGKVSASPSRLKGLTFQDPYETARKIVAKMKKANPPIDVVVALSHLERGSESKGENVKQLAGVEGIDIVISNDFRSSSNQIQLLTHVTDERTVYMVGGAKYSSLIGQLKLRIKKKPGEKGTLESLSVHKLALDGSQYNRKLRRSLVKWEIAYCNAWGKPLGQGTIRDPKGMTFEQFTQYVLNYMRFLSQTEIAFINTKALRNNNNRFPLKRFVTRDDLYQSMPYDNSMYVFKLQGRHLTDFLSSTAHNNEPLSFAGWNPDNSTVNGRPLENDKYYSVITNSFLASKYVKNLRRNVKNKKAEIEQLKQEKSSANLRQASNDLVVQTNKLNHFVQSMRKLRYANCPASKGSSCTPRLRTAMVAHFETNGFRKFPPTPVPAKPSSDSDDSDDDGGDSDDSDAKKKPPLAWPTGDFKRNEIPYTANFYRLKEWASWKFDSLINMTFNALFVSPINLETYGEIGAGDPFREYSARGQIKLNFEVGTNRHVWFNELNVQYGIYFRSAWNRSVTASVSNPEQQVTNVVDEKDDQIRFETGYKLRRWDRANIFIKYVLETEFSLRRRPDLSDEQYIQEFSEVRYRHFQMNPELGIDWLAYQGTDGSNSEIKFSFAVSWRREFALQMTPAPDSGRYKQLQQQGTVLRLPDTNHYVGFSVGYQFNNIVLARIGNRTFTFNTKGTYKLAFSITPDLPEQPLLLTHEIQADASLSLALTQLVSFDIGVVLYVLRGTLQKTDQSDSNANPNLRIQGPWAVRVTPNVSLTFRWGARGQSF